MTWVCLPDEDLAYIEDFDPETPGLKDRDLFEWIVTVQEIIAAGRHEAPGSSSAQTRGNGPLTGGGESP